MTWKRNALRAAALAAGGSAVAASGGTAYAYDGAAAANYANQYAYGPNANWVHLHPTDCANFVSQAMLAGGHDMYFSGATWWADNQGSTPWGENSSTSWIRADALRQFLDNGHNAGSYTQGAGSQKSIPYTAGPIVTGDLIFYNWDNATSLTCTTTSRCRWDGERIPTVDGKEIW